MDDGESASSAAAMLMMDQDPKRGQSISLIFCRASLSLDRTWRLGSTADKRRQNRSAITCSRINIFFAVLHAVTAVVVVNLYTRMASIAASNIVNHDTTPVESSQLGEGRHDVLVKISAGFTPYFIQLPRVPTTTLHLP